MEKLPCIEHVAVTAIPVRPRPGVARNRRDTARGNRQPYARPGEAPRGFRVSAHIGCRCRAEAPLAGPQIHLLLGNKLAPRRYVTGSSHVRSNEFDMATPRAL